MYYALPLSLCTNPPTCRPATCVPSRVRGASWVSAALPSHPPTAGLPRTLWLMSRRLIPLPTSIWLREHSGYTYSCCFFILDLSVILVRWQCDVWFEFFISCHRSRLYMFRNSCHGFLIVPLSVSYQSVMCSVSGAGDWKLIVNILRVYYVDAVRKTYVTVMHYIQNTELNHLPWEHYFFCI